MKPEVTRGSPPEAKEGITPYCNDSPARPDYDPQNGDVDWKLVFPLHDGLQLVLHCGRETYAHFVAMLSAAAVGDAEDQL